MQSSFRHLSLDRLGDEIAELSAHLDAATARLLALIREFDARGGWNTGFRSCAAWLSWRVGLDLGAARERVRVARALETLPLLAEALARGELSYAKVRALTRVATPETEARLLGGGARGHGRPRRADRARLAVGGPAGRGSGDRAAACGPGASRLPGRGRHGGRQGAARAGGGRAAHAGAGRRARDPVPAGPRAGRGAPGHGNVSAETPSMAQQQADALALLAETALHHGLDPGAPGERYQVVVHVDAPALADPDQPGQSVLEDGARVSAETSRRLACDASRVVMRHDEDGPRGGDRGPDPDDSPRPAAGAPPSGPGLPLPGLRRALRPGASSPPLGARRPDDALEPRAALPPASPRGARGGLPGRARARRGAPVPAAGRPAAARGAAACRGAR